MVLNCITHRELLNVFATSFISSATIYLIKCIRLFERPKENLGNTIDGSYIHTIKWIIVSSRDSDFKDCETCRVCTSMHIRYYRYNLQIPNTDFDEIPYISLYKQFCRTQLICEIILRIAEMIDNKYSQS